MPAGKYNRNLVISFAILISVIIIGSIYNIKIIDYFTKQTNNIRSHPYTVSNTVRDIKINLLNIEIKMKDILLTNNKNDLSELKKYLITYDSLIFKDLNTLYSRYLGPKADIIEFEDSFKIFSQYRVDIIQLVRTNKLEKAIKLNLKFENKQLKDITESLSVITKYANNKGNTYFNKIQTASKLTFKISIVFALVAIIFSIIISTLIIKISNAKEEKIKRYFHMIEKNIFSLTFDLKENIIESSNAISLFLEINKDELLNNKLNSIIKNDEKRNKLLLTVNNGFDWEDEIEYEPGIWLNIKVSPSYEDYKIVRLSMILHDISDKKRIEVASNTDQLTNLFNRRFFEDIIPKLLKQAVRSKTPAVFTMIDIDYFKQYNDLYGHQEGDVTLKEVSNILQNNTHRPNDFIFRLGGEEFGLFISCNDFEDVKKFIDNLRLLVEELHILHEKSDISKYVTVSMGAVYLDGSHDLKLDYIYKKADTLLYKAKNSGRNKLLIERI